MKKMITRRNFLKAAGVSAAALGLAACGGSGSSTAASSTAGSAAASAAASDWTWERKVTLVCPWGVGGGADGTLRPLQPVLEPILGVPVEIVNVEGQAAQTASTLPASSLLTVILTFWAPSPTSCWTCRRSCP